MGRWRWWAGAVVLVAGLGACGQAATPAAPTGPSRFVAATCPRPAAHTAFLGEPPGRFTIPKGFHPTWVLRCVITPPHTLATQRADLTPVEATRLVDTLRLPSADRSDDGCPQDSAYRAVLVTYFALVDGHGTALLPGLPEDPCRHPQDTATRALSALTYTTVSSTSFADSPGGW